MRVVLALLVLSVFITPFQRELYVGDETKYTKVVREMRTGSFFLPTLEGSPFTHKPPLHFWMVDALTHVFGVYSTWAFVLPSLAAFLLLLWACAKIARETWPEVPDAPQWAAFVCGTTLLVWGSAQTARMDVGFTALLAIAAWMLLRFLDREEGKWLLLAGLFTGLATLLKGPMAPVIAILTLVFEWIRRKGLPRGPYVRALLILAAVPLLWVVPAMILGGDAFAQEILYKQTVRRAVGAWVHKSPPWFYIQHGPGTLFPWFFALVAAVIAVYRRADARAKFHVSWLLAVLVPYSVISSKLDVYMMALVPPMALLVAWLVTSDRDDALRGFAHGMNGAMLAVLGIAGIATLVAGDRFIKGDERELLHLGSVRGLLIVLAIAGIAGAIVTLRGTLRTSSLALGLALLVVLGYIAAVLVPVANDMASTRPLIAALAQQNVPADRVALFTCPHLWSRDMPPSLEGVHYVSNEDLAKMQGKPVVVATSRRYAKDIAPQLAGYRKAGEVKMIGKWFDIYRRDGL